MNRRGAETLRGNELIEQIIGAAIEVHRVHRIDLLVETLISVESPDLSESRRLGG